MTSMEHDLSVQALKALDSGASFDVIVVVRKIIKKTSKTGNLFLQIEVGDAVDVFSFNVFEGSNPFLFFQKPGAKCPQIIKLSGTIDTYADKFSPRIKTVEEIVDPEDYHNYLPRVLETPDTAFSELQTCLESQIASIQYEGLQETVRQVFKDLGTGFLDSVAGVSMHHAYVHGLLEHTVYVTRVVQSLLPLYTDVNADLAIAGALLHDVGKVLEYHYSTTEGIDRTIVGRLQGHVVLGYRLVRSAGLRQKLNATWLERLEHIILSHQGELEWGAAVYACTPEAVLVSLADNLDARMAMVHSQMKKASPLSPFSDFVNGLQTRILTQALPDPTQPLML